MLAALPPSVQNKNYPDRSFLKQRGVSSQDGHHHYSADRLAPCTCQRFDSTASVGNSVNDSRVMSTMPGAESPCSSLPNK